MRQHARFCAFVFVAFFFAVSADFDRALAQTPTPSPTPNPVQAGQVIISEFRLRGPDSDGDGPLTAEDNEFVELYNNTDSPITVQALDASAGWSVVISNGQITGPIFAIPNGTIIPARGHYLGANELGYSLCNYPSGNGSSSPAAAPSAAASPCLTNGIGGTFAHTTPDVTWDFDVPDGYGLALFATTSGTNFNAGTRLDSAGFANSPALYREDNGIPNVVTINTEHTYYRDLRNGLPRDTGDNASDFLLVGTAVNLQVTRLGAPGPENRNSPIVNNATINASLLDTTQPSSAPPNRVRDLTSDDQTTSLFGTLFIRRRITNNTGLPVTRLRFRVINLTTDGTPGSECEGGTCAILRVLTATENTTQGGVLDQGTCAAEPTPLEPPCTVTLTALTREEPPEQPAGGGYNTSLSADSVRLASPLAAGKSINVEFRLGVMRTGPFRFFVNFEAQNSVPGPLSPADSGIGPAKDFTRKRVIADTAGSAPGAAPAGPAAAPAAASGNVYAPFIIYRPPTPAADDEEEKEDEGKEKKSEKKSEETPPSAEPAPQTPAADSPAPAADEAAPRKKQPAAAKASRRGEQ